MKFKDTVQPLQEMVKNETVIDIFINDKFPKDKLPTWGSANLKINKERYGWSLINYSTPILYRPKDSTKFYFNTMKYSTSTSRIQSIIKRALDGKSFDEVKGKSQMDELISVEDIKTKYKQIAKELQKD